MGFQRVMQALRVAESARVASETARVAAEQALEQQKAEQLQLVATAYSTGAQHAAREARRSPPLSGAASSHGGIAYFDLSSGERYQSRETGTTSNADVENTFAKAEGSERPTNAPTTTKGSVSGASVSSDYWPFVGSNNELTSIRNSTAANFYCDEELNFPRSVF